MMPQNKPTEERQPNDRYQTPVDYARWFVQVFPRFNTAKTVLDLGCAEGRLARAYKELFPDVHTVGVDNMFDVKNGIMLDDYREEDVLNPCSSFRGKLYDRVVMNPPFFLLNQFVKVGLECLTKSGLMAVLCRMQSLETDGRWMDLWRADAGQGLVHVSMGVDRPRFEPYMTPDGAPYVFLVFKRNFEGPTTFSFNHFGRRETRGDGEYFNRSFFVRHAV